MTMIKQTIVLGSILAACGLGGQATAADKVKATQKTTAVSGVKAGKAKSADCASCHGEGGKGMAPLFPKLAGLPANYFTKQIMDFKSGGRADPTMAAIVAGLSEQDIENLALYYATQTPKPEPIQPASKNDEDEDDEDAETADGENEDDLSPEELIALGKKIYRAGNPTAHLPACSACHGAEATGNAAAGFPPLRYQYADYVSKSLSQYQSGTRKNDPSAMMRGVAAKMSHLEIEAVAAYLAHKP